MDVRKEQRIGGSGWPALAPHPQMVASPEGLPTSANIRIPPIISQLDDLVLPTISVTQIRRLRLPEVDVEALFPTG